MTGHGKDLIRRPDVSTFDGARGKAEICMSNEKRHPPPPVIDAARVISYAYTDDIPYCCTVSPFTDEAMIEPVPRLAIAVGLGGQPGSVVLHCDEDWISLGISDAETVEEAKEGVARSYPGVSWIDTYVTVEEALAYYDSETAGLKCSFCGKRPFQVEGIIEAPTATICRNCVEDFYCDFQVDGEEEVGN